MDVPPRPGEGDPGDGGDEPDNGGEDEDAPRERVVIKLADGKDRRIQFIGTTTYWIDGKVVSAREFIDRLYGNLVDLVTDEDHLRTLWGAPETRERFMEQLTEQGFDLEHLTDIRRLIDAQDSDIFDVLAYIRFASAPKTREERAEAAKGEALEGSSEPVRELLEGVLENYKTAGHLELNPGALIELLKIRYGTMADARGKLGDLKSVRDAFVRMQPRIYQD